MSEKRMISDTGYEVTSAFRIGGKEILLGENMSAEDGQHYIVCQYREFGIFSEYSRGEASGDYLEVLREYTTRINAEISTLQAERDALSLPGELFTSQHCLPHSRGDNIDGKLIAIKAEVFSPEYRRGDNQLVYVVGGAGAQANSGGNAVFCYHLNNSTHTRFERYEVLGELRSECVPAWAQERLAHIKAELSKPPEERECAGNYEITEFIEAGAMVYALGHNKDAVKPYGTWERRTDSTRGYDVGHYFDTKEEATADLHARAGREQRRLDSPKRSRDGR